MKKKELVILTARNRFFGQTRKPWSSIDVGKVAALFEQEGHQVEVYDFHQVFNENLNIENKTILYAFSQKENYREYIRDIMYHLSKKNRIIPDYDLLKCHENKGYQEIYKREIGLNGLLANYYTSHKEIDTQKVSFPLVLKTTRGSNGKGVYLITGNDQLKKVLKKLKNTFDIFTHIDLFRRRYFRKKKFKDYPNYSDLVDYYEYKEYLVHEMNFVLQQFVPNLDFDYRVLVAHDRYYVMKRDVKIGDFRASGSKIFSFDQEPDVGLLDFSSAIYEKFDAPFLSIDVLYNGTDYYMVEYQALHFGTSVVAKSKGFFTKTSGSWVFIKEKPVLESIFASTYHKYLQEH